MRVFHQMTHLLPLLLLLLPSLTTPLVVEQVHLAFSDDPHAMTVSWSSPTASTSLPTVTYWPSAAAAASPLSNNRTVVASQDHFIQHFNTSHPLAKCPGCVNEWLSSATLDELMPGVRYAYSILASSSGGASLFTSSFLAGREATHGENFTFAVFGDMGTHVPDGDPSPNLQMLTQDVNDGIIQGVLHVGDFAYVNVICC
jgi:hypothetical protein